MGNFHRFVDPVYGLFPGESFPGTPGGTGTIGGHTYDRANVTSGGVGGPGGAALVGGQKAAGVNQYTYFVAFGEDATSQNTNRGMRALAQNTDVLDDLFRTNVPKYIREFYTAPGANFLQLVGDVFVGDDPSLSVGELINVRGATSTMRLYNGSTPITVSAIDTGTPGASVIGDGWATNPTIRFTAVVSESVLVTYGTRSSTARMIEAEREGLWRFMARADLEALAAHSLRLHGLNERYRRATFLSSVSSGATTDVAGAGGRIIRDGQALEVQEPELDYVSAGRPDPFLALFKATKSGTLGAQNHNYNGAVGFLSLSSAVASGEQGDTGRNFADFLSLQQRNVVSDDVGGTGLTFTRISVNTTVKLNPLNAGGTRVKLTNASEYWSRSGKFAAAIGVDLVLITRASGAKELYYINAFLDTTTITVSKLTGSGAVAFPQDEDATLTWIHRNTALTDSGFQHYSRPVNTSGDATDFGTQAYFAAASKYREYAVGGLVARANRALSWGGFDENGALYSMFGHLLGDGSIDAVQVVGAHVDTTESAGGSGTTYTVTFRGTGSLTNAKSASMFLLDAGASSGAVAMNVLLDGVIPTGASITVVLNVQYFAATVTMNWNGGSGFVFSGDQEQVPAGQTGTYKWEGKYNGSAFLMTRVDYGT